jgi:hypothetical protein
MALRYSAYRTNEEQLTPQENTGGESPHVIEWEVLTAADWVHYLIGCERHTWTRYPNETATSPLFAPDGRCDRHDHANLVQICSNVASGELGLFLRFILLLIRIGVTYDTY